MAMRDIGSQSGAHHPRNSLVVGSGVCPPVGAYSASIPLRTSTPPPRKYTTGTYAPGMGFPFQRQERRAWTTATVSTTVRASEANQTWRKNARRVGGHRARRWKEIVTSEAWSPEMVGVKCFARCGTKDLLLAWRRSYSSAGFYGTGKIVMHWTRRRERGPQHGNTTPHHVLSSTGCWWTRNAAWSGPQRTPNPRSHSLKVNAAKRSIGFEKATQVQSARATTVILHCCCTTSRYVLCSARFSRLIPHCPCKRSSQRVAVVSKPAPLQQPSNGESIRIQQYVHNYERNSPIYHEDAMRQALQQAFGEARDRCTGATAAQHISEALVPWATAAVLLS